MSSSDINPQLIKLWRDYFSKEPESFVALQQHASPRKRFRMTLEGQSYIGVVYANAAENRAFLHFAKCFLELGLHVPQVLTSNLEHGVYIEQDLGSTTLYDFLLEQRGETFSVSEQVEQLYRKALEELVRFQIDGGKSLDFSFCVGKQIYDSHSMLFDMHSFRDEFLKRIDFHFHEAALENDFIELASFLSDPEEPYFLYRDFQARNIMLHADQLYFIDFQSGSRGPLQCDVISLLYQSQARIPEETRERLLEHYLEVLTARCQIDRASFCTRYDGFIYLRLMQVLGAYGKLGLGQRKSYFLEGIPSAIENIHLNLKRRGLPVEAPCLEQIFLALGEQKREN